MSVGRIDLESLRGRKRPAGPPIVMVTAYDVVSGAVARAARVDVALVGDSAANVVLGHATTREVGMGEMLVLAAAARRGLARGPADAPVPLLVGDLPFGSYEASDAIAVENARRFVTEAGCDAVKLEGGGAMVERVRAIVAEGIPVMGHVGLLPQSAATEADLRVQGRTSEPAIQIARDAVALDEAGCFAIVFEAVPAPLAALVAPRVGAPVIGIGAGAAVDGQVLVYHDLLGLHQGRRPRFVKQYAALFDRSVEGVAAYAAEVRAGGYPGPEHSYGMDEGELASVRAALDGG
ncbi:MAG TPA: 3-methyl-2-oxobutanoate hydroxymethyltransferase [Gemmatimonadaceae bacterium]|nr:3-methyl-2-oxobutanoate hydroxymethyltransferase [Gemmatimonadaceae bacterium]